MKNRNLIPGLFLALTISQVIHSSEEIYFRLYDWQEYLWRAIECILGIKTNLKIDTTLFSILNICFITILFPVCIGLFRQTKHINKIALILVTIELINSLVHISISLSYNFYLPGTISAVALFVFSCSYIAVTIRNRRGLV